jgi:hypothetical protein
MRTVSTALWNAVALGTTSAQSNPFRLENLEGASVQLSVAAAGDIVGTVTIQGSNDGGGPSGATDPYMPSNINQPTITNWTDIPSMSMTLSALTGSPFLRNLSQLYFKWIRLSYTYGSGTSSTVTAIAFGKGPM